MGRQRKPVVIAVSGVKNSGKTTFLTHILPLLRERGLSVGVIKHDGHEFEPDVEGTDSWKLRQAGADATAVFCRQHFMMIRNQPISEEWLLEQFFDLDLVLLEGFKDSGYKKIELIRGEVSRTGVCDPETLLAVATDVEEYLGVTVPASPRSTMAVATDVEGYLERPLAADEDAGTEARGERKQIPQIGLTDYEKAVELILRYREEICKGS